MRSGSLSRVRRPGRGVDYPLSYSAEVKEGVDYSLLPLGAFMAYCTFTFTAVYDGLCTGDWCFLRGRNEVLHCNLDECEALYLIGRTDRDEHCGHCNKIMLLFEFISSSITSSVSFLFSSIVVPFCYCLSSAVIFRWGFP